MTSKKAFSLKNGDKVFHKFFGNCIVKDIIPMFGPTIIPDTDEGRAKLSYLSGMPGDTPYIASDYKQNLKEVAP